jgi:hypothetical protein
MFPWSDGGLHVGLPACAKGRATSEATNSKRAQTKSLTEVRPLDFLEGSEQIADWWVSDKEFMKLIPRVGRVVSSANGVAAS